MEFLASRKVCYFMCVRVCADAGTHVGFVNVLIHVLCVLTSVYSQRPGSQEYSAF